MLDPKKVVECGELCSQIKPGTDEWERAAVYSAQFHLDVYQIIKKPMPAREKERELDARHEQYINLIRNLVLPIVKDDGPLPGLPFIGDFTVMELLAEWCLMMGALMMVREAWDKVKPIGWVASGKGDPTPIPHAIKGMRALLEALCPTTEK
jgi:hypothetical protein